MTKVKFHLTKPARKSGGDRYEGTHKSEDFVIYIPQTISRPKGAPIQNLEVSFNPVD
jgi:hypothetical protein